jgi:hypothetical protein
MTMVRTRLALALCTALLSGLALAACGSSTVSDAVPKSTPDLIPPTDTRAEKAAVQTTSTSTTSTKTATSESSESESGAGETPSSETGGSASEGTASGGTGSEEKEAKETPKTEESAGNSSPTGGASAP